MPVRPTSAASVKSATVKRSPFEVTDPELIKKPTLRRPKVNTPMMAVKKGTKELDSQVAAMQARLAALKAEAAAAAKQTDDIKRRTEEVSLTVCASVTQSLCRRHVVPLAVSSLVTRRTESVA